MDLTALGILRAQQNTILLSDMDTHKDPEPSPMQLEVISKLTEEQIEEIDQAILNIVDERYRKVAFIVGSVMASLGNKFEGIPDVYYSKRVTRLVEKGDLVAQGFVGRMRYCEVKRSL